LEVLKHVIELKYEIIIVTNQYLLGEGTINQAQYDKYTRRLVRLLASVGVEIRDIFYCPHARWVDCRCRKPSTGLFDQAIDKYPLIDLSTAFLVGDSICDVELAKAVGIPSFGVGLGYSGSIHLPSISDLCDHQLW